MFAEFAKSDLGREKTKMSLLVWVSTRERKKERKNELHQKHSFSNNQLLRLDHTAHTLT